jgi:hypothetical protein
MAFVFGVTSGSVIGREHVRVGRNNQDGVAVRADDQRLAAVVTDGCSSSKFAEVGARLGAAFVAGDVLKKLRSGKTAGMDLAYASTRALVSYLDTLAKGLASDDAERDALIGEYLLFGFLCLAIDGQKACVFGVGDGVVSLNGEMKVLDPGPENAPPYVGYLLMRGPTRSASPELHVSSPVDHVETLMIGTDGLLDLDRTPDVALKDGERQGGMEQFEEDDTLITNAGRLQRRLTLLGEVNRRMRDDTTVVVVRRVSIR